MKNPTYLSLSRHHIYYFRYPVNDSQGLNTVYIKLSLGTRNSKEALYLSKVLEYHGCIMTQNIQNQHLSHAEIVSMLKGYFAEVLGRAKKRIDQDGPLPAENVYRIERELDKIRDAINTNRDEIHGNLFMDDDDIPKELSIKETLGKIQGRFDLILDEGGKEYSILLEEYKYALRNYFDALLSYNLEVRNYSFGEFRRDIRGHKVKELAKPEYKLSVIVEKYLADMERTGTWGIRATEERVSCLNYLIEFLGEGYDFLRIDGDAARKVKEALMGTPTNRSKLKETKDLPLHEQIKVCAELELSKLSNGSINKYLQVYSSFCTWSVQNKYIKENPFASMGLKDSKKNKREAFSKDEIALMLSEIDKKDKG
ncbi:MAG: hypothetical protein QF692_01980 [Alphaproteobacteria bacterium]|jgi:hypothetical protein|nr:hypothetical protein [Alphaproteobacteria bacterium]MDP7222013.1 hypothetical protein [Alphaproteobacteria bacterium]